MPTSSGAAGGVRVDFGDGGIREGVRGAGHVDLHRVGLTEPAVPCSCPGTQEHVPATCSLIATAVEDAQAVRVVVFAWRRASAAAVLMKWEGGVRQRERWVGGGGSTRSPALERWRVAPPSPANDGPLVGPERGHNSRRPHDLVPQMLLVKSRAKRGAVEAACARQGWCGWAASSPKAPAHGRVRHRMVGTAGGHETPSRGAVRLRAPNTHPPGPARPRLAYFFFFFF